MADIQIVYHEFKCKYNVLGFDLRCFCACAADHGCKYFYGGEKDNKTLLFGDCQRMTEVIKRKGWTGKRYEMEEREDPYTPRLDCMRVTLGNTEYDCLKVVLDGKCIYNIYDDEAVG